MPDTGKSSFCCKLAEKPSFLHLASDALRKILFPSPKHKENENKRLFSACHVLIGEHLRKGIPVILDVTSLLEHHREYLCRAAERAVPKLIFVCVEAPTEVVQQRLLAQEETAMPRYDSEAGREVYNKMKTRRERICRNHLVVDTAQDITAVIDKIVRSVKK